MTTTDNNQPDLLTIYLEVRRGDKRVVISRKISMLLWNQLKDDGYHGLYEAALNGMRVELEPHVRLLAATPPTQREEE